MLLAGGIWLLLTIFQTSVRWGLLSLLLPVVSLVFAAMHWQESKNAFLIQMLGLALLLTGFAIAPGQTAAAS